MPTPGGVLSSLTQTGLDGVEPGLGTSEFLISAVTEVIALIDAFGWHHFTQAQDAAVLALVPIVYTAARAVRKGLAGK